MPSKKLTDKQKLFVGEYLVDLNATNAAIRAGYSKKNADKIGSQLLGKARVHEAIQKAMDKRSKRTEIKADSVLEGICEVIDRCRQSRPVLNRKGEQVFIQTPDGEQAAAYTFEAFACLKGYELIGKHLKLFTEKYEIEDKTLDDDERRKRISELLSRANRPA